MGLSLLKPPSPHRHTFKGVDMFLFRDRNQGQNDMKSGICFKIFQIREKGRGRGREGGEPEEKGRMKLLG